MRRPALAALALALACASCGSRVPAPELLVIVATDIPDLDAIDVDVTSPDGSNALHRTFPIPATPLPLSLAVIPADGDPSRQITARATGRTGTTTRVSVFARTHFVAGEVRVLTLFLSASCGPLYAGCEASMQTCRGGACSAATIDPTALPRTDIDAGGVDAATDMRTDAPPVDAARDTGVSAPTGGDCDTFFGPDCRAGDACTSLGGENGICRRLCTVGAAGDAVCGGVFGATSRCVHDATDGVDVCTTGCSPLSGTGCPSDTACDFFTATAGAPISTITATDCRALGPGGNGSSCTSSRCALGYTCVTFASVGTVCSAFCLPSAPSTCTAFGTCPAAVSPTGYTFCRPFTDGGVDAGPRDGGLDAPASDLGMDAGTDAGASDLGVDAGPPDLGDDAGPPDLGDDAGAPDM